ncbi:hypothetical protein IJS77_01125 [bacterium]|nr:hypothetical protein [bacterium]
METAENYTPKMLRDIFDTDNSGISSLCREARLIPKKDLSGNTYFTKHDVQTLKKINELHSKNSILADELMMSSSKELPMPVSAAALDETFNKLNDRFEMFQKTIEEKISTVIDEKLDGMDEVVVELIRCKTENETLRFKMNELEKLNYSLKNQISSYKNIGFNLYVKKEL